MATAAVVLMFVLFGHGLLRRSLSALTVRAAQRVEAALPNRLDPQRRDRLARRLRGYVSAPLEDQSAGRFLQLTARLLEDDRLTREEVDELEAFFEEAPRGRVE